MRPMRNSISSRAASARVYPRARYRSSRYPRYGPPYACVNAASVAASASAAPSLAQRGGGVASPGPGASPCSSMGLRHTGHVVFFCSCTHAPMHGSQNVCMHGSTSRARGARAGAATDAPSAPVAATGTAAGAAVDGPAAASLPEPGTGFTEPRPSFCSARAARARSNTLSSGAASEASSPSAPAPPVPAAPLPPRVSKSSRQMGHDDGL
mmetsp:Transcript_41995/g.125722  ORF Transcript_41995/g.125722 Transcript_41995/m.125722 type:complete len:210 (+) Transcript_41995:786-1415(+)